MSNESPSTDAVQMPVVLSTLSHSPLGDVGGSKPGGMCQQWKTTVTWSHVKVDVQDKTASCLWRPWGKGKTSSSSSVWRDGRPKVALHLAPAGWSDNDGPSPSYLGMKKAKIRGKTGT